MLFTIEIERLYVHAPIGVFPQEKLACNDIWVDIALIVDIPPSAISNDDINGTINYGDIATIAQEVCNQGADLIETIAAKIIRQIINYSIDHIAAIKKITVKVTKTSPPIEGCQVKGASATLQWENNTNTFEL